jgi:tyrosine aminotransferase
VVSDEIYGEMVFAGEVYTPLANLNAERARAWTSSSPAKASPVPLITAGGLAKRWLVPGWRIGWLLLHDPADLFGFPFTKVLKDACAISLAPSSLPQAAVPAILRDTPASFYAAALAVVQENARLVEARLNRIAGLRVVKPRGSLYVLVGVDAAVFVGIKNEWDFVQKLVWEEAVFPRTCILSVTRSGPPLTGSVVPGKCFRFEGYMRIVTSSKREDLEEACVRLELFCERHRKR